MEPTRRDSVNPFDTQLDKLMHRISLHAAILLGLFVSAFANGQSVGPSYEVDMSDALNHYVTVTMTAEATGDETEIMMATWTPGSYLVREYAKHVDRIEAQTAKGRGKKLDIEKISKNRWRVDTSNAKQFKVTYRIFCNSLSVRTNYVGQGYGVLNGAPTFITLPDQLDRPHIVTLKLPAKWKRSATSLHADGDEPHRYVATDYDELVDSPIVAGNVSFYPFKVDGVEHTLVNVNEAGYWDGEKAARDLAKVVAAHHELWGNIPYDRYMFINVIGGGGGGLEHDNCCLMMSSRWSFRSEGGYIRWLSLASHEFFHTWNIRRLRPKSLVKYDYENEVYTPSLWVAEGVTSYYEDLLLVRAGLMSEDDFIAGLAGSVSQVQRSKGSKVQSLRDSSHDAWIKFYRPEANSSDTTVSYYTKGAVVAFLLDAQIRKESKGQHSLDDVMRKLYEEHANPVGYLPSDFRRICSEMAGTDLSQWFAGAVDSTDDLQWQDLCNWYGVQVGDIKPLKPGEEAPKPRDAKPSRTRWIGIGEPNSPASKAGLSDSDEILAVNELRLNGGIESRIQQFDVGDAITLLISREDKIMNVAVTIGSRPVTPSWGLSKYRKATDDQKTNLKNWLQGITVAPSESEVVQGDSESESQPADSDGKATENVADPADATPELTDETNDTPTSLAPVKAKAAVRKPVSAVKSKLTLAIEGAETTKVGETVSLQMIISNSTDQDIENVKLSNTFSSLNPTSASAKYPHSWSNHQFTVDVGTVKANETATVKIDYEAMEVDQAATSSFTITTNGQYAASEKHEVNVQPKD